MEIRIGRPKNQSIDPKKKYKKNPKTLDQILKESFTKEVSKNPILRDKMASKLISKEYGIEIDSAGEQRQAIESKINKATMDELDKNTELMGELTRQRAYDIMGTKIKPKRENNGDEDSIPYEEMSPLARALQEIRDLKEFQEEAGIEDKKGGSFSDLLKDPEIIKALLTFIASMNGGSKQPEQIVQAPTRTFVMEINGQLQEMNEQDYIRYRQQLAAPKPQPNVIEQPKAEEKPKITEVKPEEPKQVEPPSDPIMDLLNMEPALFAKTLEEKIEDEDEQAVLLWNLLRGEVTYESIKMMLMPYAENPEYKAYIEKIISRPDWVTSIIKEVKIKQNAK